MMDEGLRIQIIDKESRPMFKVGSATVEPLYERYFNCDSANTK